jgi:signal transduction histidine kinase
VRILVAYLALLAISTLVATHAIRTILEIRLENRTEAALRQEVLEFHRQARARDPHTGRPFASLQALLDSYLVRNVPSDEEAMLAFLGGRLHRVARNQFPLDTLPPEKLGEWAQLSRGGRAKPLTGSLETDRGTGYYRALPLGRSPEAGAFVVAILPAAEFREIRALQWIGVAVTFAVLLVASVFAWLVVGRLVAPVRVLTEAARTISQPDRTGRIEARGTNEAAELVASFNAMLDRLEAAFRRQLEFVRDTSHELRDPLTVSRGHLEVLGPASEEQRQTVNLVLDELDRMARIVEDLQLLANAERPDFIRPEPVELGSFVRELALKATALAPRRWELDKVPEGTLVADRHRLTQAMLNLAHNAVQHTDRDGIVAIGASANVEEIRLWVRDTGTGIAAADRARIFDRFVRGSGSHGGHHGSGVGLAIVKALAEAHGGRVEVESRLGAGSKFTIVIPLKIGR